MQGLGAIIQLGPLSIRYATGIRNCALFQLHIQASYLYMPALGPVIIHSPDLPEFFDGELELGMVICVECYIGEIGTVQGIKLEDQVLVSASGPIALSRYPFEEAFLAREI